MAVWVYTDWSVILICGISTVPEIVLSIYMHSSCFIQFQLGDIYQERFSALIKNMT